MHRYASSVWVAQADPRVCGTFGVLDTDGVMRAAPGDT